LESIRRAARAETLLLPVPHGRKHLAECGAIVGHNRSCFGEMP